MSKWVIVFLLNGCSEDFLTGNSNDGGNRVLSSDSAHVDSRSVDNPSIEIRKPVHTIKDSSISIQQKDADASITKEAEVHESSIDSVQESRQKDSGSKDANVVDNHHDRYNRSDSMVDGNTNSNSDSGRPNCDDKTLVGCTGLYGQPCRTYRLPPYKCVCLLPSEDCVLK
jgi:hypothetical protein